ncbi:ATP-dependent helicase C-terminal domain-containing protein [Salinispirillum marinum]|uniref:ATP-dependent helicase C-terminal domain-containing protein n=2 Tax=Saccharospirillaceae TaxID=255527 RepID=A0ABV8BJ33_9GAMM
MTAPHDLVQLPLYEHKSAFLDRRKNPLLIEAEPGAGKSTLIPLWAMESCPAGQQVWLIQPRILATRAVSKRLRELSEKPHWVGYQVPYERQIGPQARLVVMTPGIFLQRLLHDPELPGVHTVILDEIHERSVQQDLAWVWLQELLVLREQLNVIVMTATPDPTLRAQVPTILRAEGRQFPVQTHWLPSQDRERLAQSVCRALRVTPVPPEATVLVFLPGWQAIEDTHRALHQTFPERSICRLHSNVPPEEQANALNPDSGWRIILSTNIAETALTVPDVTWVIDSGLARYPSFDQVSGITRLVTRQISAASADQRRGRAGRILAGNCIRLWSAERPLAPAERPDIVHTDALALALYIAHWGTPANQLLWPDKPSLPALQLAHERLAHWGLLQANGKISPKGELANSLGTEPRIAVWLLSFHTQTSIPSTALTLALCLHFMPEMISSDEAWLTRAEALSQQHPHWQQMKQRWLRQLALSESPKVELADLALRFAHLFPERIGLQQPSERYRLTMGISAECRELNSSWAVFVTLSPEGKRISGFALPLTLTKAQEKALSQPTTRTVQQGKGWFRETQWILGNLTVAVEREPLSEQDIPSAILAEITAQGLWHFNWPEAAAQLLIRAQVALDHELIPFGDLGENALLSTLGEWLLPFLSPDSRLQQLPWLAALEYRLGHEHLRALNSLVPNTLRLPSGREVSIHYRTDTTPTSAHIEGKLQEFFGATTMEIAEGRIPLTLHLLSPAGRPLAITGDLTTFWQNAYPDIRKEMRGRYPRHPWPDNPSTHVATRLTKRGLAQRP